MSLQLTVKEVKDLRLDVFLIGIADGIHSLMLDRYELEVTCARVTGRPWSVEGAKNYRDLCAAEAVIRTLVVETKNDAKASGKTSPISVKSGEAGRREWTCVEVGIGFNAAT